MAIKPKRSSPRPVGTFVPQLTRKAFEKYGFSAAALISDWASIVGPDLARQTSPERLKWPRAPTLPAGEEASVDGTPARQGATLFLRVEGPRALEIDYKRAELAERINAYFGYRAVGDIRIQQAPLPKPKPQRAAQITASDRTPLPEVGDAGLRGALEKLGAGIKARRRMKHGG